jgi:uncharacterized RDD family membrane protein YckC
MTSPQNPFAAPASGAAALTPEPVEGELASRVSRLAAAIIDVLIMMAVFFPIFLVLGFTVTEQQGPMVQIMIGGVAVLVSLGINGWLLHTRGQTLGKMVMKIRIVRVDGVATTGWDTIGKRLLPLWLVQMIPVIGSFLGLLDVLFIFRQDRRCLHDMVAGTEVISLKSANGR